MPIIARYVNIYYIIDIYSGRVVPDAHTHDNISMHIMIDHEKKHQKCSKIEKFFFSKFLKK